jgi:hypothetical protein
MIDGRLVAKVYSLCIEKDYVHRHCNKLLAPPEQLLPVSLERPFCASRSPTGGLSSDGRARGPLLEAGCGLVSVGT